MLTDILDIILNMQWYTVVLLISGIVCLCVEVFTAGFGFFGISGITLIVAGIVSRVVWAGLSVEKIFLYVCYMVGLLVVILIILFFIMLYSAKYGFLSKSALVLSRTAVPVKKTEGTLDYSKLVGKVGVTITNLKPIGKAKINDVIYDVDANGKYIYKNIDVKVVSVEGSKIVVEEVE